MKKINLKSILLLLSCYAVIAGVSIGATFAYITEQDNNLTVAAAGQVQIEQIELQRKQDGSGVLEAFADNKEFYPAVYENVVLDSNSQKWESGGESLLLHSDMQNVIDKFVFIKNTGSHDAYVRTWFAFEAGELTPARFKEILHLNINTTNWTWSPWNQTSVEIDGVKYYVVSATYNTVLESGNTTMPSLLQFFLDRSTTTEESIPFGSEYNVIAFSQAVESSPFQSPAEAFGAEFGANHPWSN